MELTVRKKCVLSRGCCLVLKVLGFEGSGSGVVFWALKWYSRLSGGALTLRWYPSWYSGSRVYPRLSSGTLGDNMAGRWYPGCQVVSWLSGGILGFQVGPTALRWDPEWTLALRWDPRLSGGTQGSQVGP